MFAGNIGEAQDVENIINCIKLTKKNLIQILDGYFWVKVACLII